MFYTHCSFSVAQQSSRRGLILPPDSRVHLCLEYFLLPCHISLTSLSFPSASLCLTGSYYFCIFTASHAALMQSKRNDDDWMNGLNPSLLLYRQILYQSELLQAPDKSWIHNDIYLYNIISLSKMFLDSFILNMSMCQRQGRWYWTHFTDENLWVRYNKCPFQSPPDGSPKCHHNTFHIRTGAIFLKLLFYETALAPGN